MGQIHAANAASNSRTRLLYVVARQANKAQALASQHGAVGTSDLYVLRCHCIFDTLIGMLFLRIPVFTQL